MKPRLITVNGNATAAHGAAELDIFDDGESLFGARHLSIDDVARRVDMHDDLLAALEGVVRCLPALWGDHVRDGKVIVKLDESTIDAINKLLARAKVEMPVAPPRPDPGAEADPACDECGGGGLVHDDDRCECEIGEGHHHKACPVCCGPRGWAHADEEGA